MQNKNVTKFDNDLFLASVIKDPDPSFIDNSGKVIRTDDFGLAITLFHTGAKLLSVNKENSENLIFVFKKISNLQDVMDEFYSDLLTVKSFSFLESIKAFRKTVDKHINKNNHKLI